MAQLERRMLGDVTGKIGGVVFRIARGRNFMALAPYKYSKPDTEEYREKTARFKSAVLFGKAAGRLLALQNIWSRVFPHRRAYNIYISVNYPHALPGDIKETAVISPPEGFGVRLDSAVLTDTTISIALHPLSAENGIDTSVEKLIKLEAVVVLSRPSKTDEPLIRTFAIQSEIRQFNLTDPLEFTFLLSTAMMDFIRHYSTVKIFCSLITLDANSNPVKASKTFCTVL